MIKLNSLSINEKEHQYIASLLQILSDIERVSDYCENISEFAETFEGSENYIFRCGKKNCRR